MGAYPKIVACLELASGDDDVLRNAVLFAGLPDSAATKVYFLHAARTLDLPESVRREYPELVQPLDEFAREQIAQNVTRIVGDVFPKAAEIEVLEGPMLDVYLRRARQKDADLVIVGGGDEKKRSLAEKMARKAPCSVLVATEGSPAKLSRILVAVDFSRHSERAARSAVKLAVAADSERVDCVHAFSVPSGFHKTGQPYDEFLAVMSAKLQHLLDRFVAREDDTGRLRALPVVNDPDPLDAIIEIARRESYDLVVVGARGRGAGTALMLGSNTERLIRRSMVPVLAVKEKRAARNILDALLGE